MIGGCWINKAFGLFEMHILFHYSVEKGSFHVHMLNLQITGGSQGGKETKCRKLDRRIESLIIIFP